MLHSSSYKPTASSRNLNLYRKSDALYQLTVVFCRRFLSATDDPASDQMLQAARSGKQNLVEGSEDGRTSTESEIKLITVARASVNELREDYENYLEGHDLQLWGREHPRFEAMLTFCRQHNDYVGYAPLASQLNAEEFCNLAVTLCHIVDKMMMSYLQYLERRFSAEGGIRERTYSARTGYRQQQDETLRHLQEENHRLQNELQRLQEENRRLQEENQRLQEENTFFQ